jgi:Bacterial SCP ortholog
MPPRRRTDPAVGEAALTAWRADPDGVDRATRGTAVRYTLDELGARAPGRSVEVRVPPFGAVQCVQGPRHTRGTPPNVVESDAETWLRLATGTLTWADALATGRLRVSGTRAHLDTLLPLAGPEPVEAGEAVEARDAGDDAP